MKTDMSPQAVTARLKKTSELRRLCLALGGDRLKEKLRKAATARPSVTPPKPHESASRQGTSPPCSETP